MAKKAHGTLDIFTEWHPPMVQAALPKSRVHSADIPSKICQAMKLALEDCGISRDEISAAMGDYLGEPVTANMLDAYVSQAKEGHKINLPRFAAFIHATGDMRLLSLLPELFGYAVIPVKYMGAVNEAITIDQIENLQKQKTVFRREWKSGRS